MACGHAEQALGFRVGMRMVREADWVKGVAGNFLALILVQLRRVKGF